MTSQVPSTNIIEDVPTNPYLNLACNLEKLIYLITTECSTSIIADEAMRIQHLITEYGDNLLWVVEQLGEALEDTIISATIDPERLTDIIIGWLYYLQQNLIFESRFYFYPDLGGSEGGESHRLYPL